CFFFIQAEDAIRDRNVTGVQRVLFRSKQIFEKNESSFGESDYLNYADLHILPPVSRPEKIICVGLNYLDHVSEGPDMDVPEEPEIGRASCREAVETAAVGA